ncbi:MAG: HEAT repeat domain-containing protein [Ignavibacteriales bacterium]|nr:HEAT repeat domain-containing protein [Ignavibacteriales bacterium]
MKKKTEHERYDELLQLSFCDELQSAERDELEQHLRSCPRCRKEQTELAQFHAGLKKTSRLASTPQMLREAREELHSLFAPARSRRKIGGVLMEYIERFLRPQWSPGTPAWVGAICLLIGVGAGYVLFRSHEPAVPVADAVDEARTANVRILTADPKSGDMELAYETVTPRRVIGKLGSPEIQSLVANVLLHEENPGEKLRTLSVISRQQEFQTAIDPVVKQALLFALKNDDNPGVRQEALHALTEYAFDNEIKDVLLQALLHDQNAGVRVSAINALELGANESRLRDPAIQKVLKKKMNEDNNTYVRQQAQLFVKEVSLL